MKTCELLQNDYPAVQLGKQSVLLLGGFGRGTTYKSHKECLPRRLAAYYVPGRIALLSSTFFKVHRITHYCHQSASDILEG